MHRSAAIAGVSGARAAAIIDGGIAGWLRVESVADAVVTMGSRPLGYLSGALLTFTAHALTWMILRLAMLGDLLHALIETAALGLVVLAAASHRSLLRTMVLGILTHLVAAATMLTLLLLAWLMANLVHAVLETAWLAALISSVLMASLLHALGKAAFPFAWRLAGLTLVRRGSGFALVALVIVVTLTSDGGLGRLVLGVVMVMLVSLLSNLAARAFGLLVLSSLVQAAAFLLAPVVDAGLGRGGGPPEGSQHQPNRHPLNDSR